MKTVFRGEFFRLSRSAVLLLAIAVLLVCDLFISSRSKVTESNLYDLAELPGAGTFVNFFQDNKLDVAYLKSDKGKGSCAYVMSEGILNYIAKYGTK